MGCDIHCYVEFQDYREHWNSFGGRVNPGRDYDTFKKLAGVRSQVPAEIAYLNSLDPAMKTE